MERLIFLTLSLTKGGAERVICNMCNEYFVKRYDVTIISLMAAEPEYALDARVHFRTIDTRTDQYRQSLPLRFLRRRRGLSRALRELSCKGRPKAVISFLPEPNFLITSLAGQTELPVIISVRNDPVREYGSKVRYWMMRALYPRADKAVFQTEAARDYFRFSAHLMANSYVIPNPLSREFIGAAFPERRRKEIVAVGRLEQQKEPLFLLRVFARLHKEFPDYRILFYGDGSLRHELEEEIRELGLEGYALLKGNVDHIQDAIRDAALFVLASRYEGMPNALMEAMALGLPCIATDCPCGGPASLIESGANGLLVPVGDESAMLEAMRSILSEEKRALQMGREAQRITEKLDPDGIYAVWDRIVQGME